MTENATPNLAMFLHTLAADVAAGAPRPYQLSIPVNGTAEMQIWPDHDREIGVALWGRVLGADTIRVEHGWGSTGSVHYSVSGDYCPGWTLKVWTAGTVESDKSVAYHPISLYVDRLDQPTSTPVEWLEPGRAADDTEAPAWTDETPPIVGEEAGHAIRRALADGYVDPVDHPGD